MSKHITIQNTGKKYNTNTLDLDVLSRAWGANAMGDLGGWLELASIDPQETFKSRNIKDHPYIGKRIYFKFLDDAGYTATATVINCRIHPKGRLLFDLQFPEPIPDILYPFGKRQEFTLIDRGKHNGCIERLWINQLQNYGMEA